MNTPPHIFSFFAGVGFLDLGFEDAGFVSAFVNEFHEPFLNAYIYARERIDHFQPLYGYHEGSIEDLLMTRKRKFLQERITTSRKKNALVGFIAGPPCPDFSVGGKNRGATGDKGRLSKAYIQLILDQKPDFFLFENVKGLLRTKKHRRFYDSLKNLLIDDGYILADKLVNSLAYGVGQDRDRILLFGIKQKLAEDLEKEFNPLTFHIENGEFPWDERTKYNPERIFTEYDWPDTSPFEPNSHIPRPKRIPEELTVEHWFTKNAVENHPNSQDYFHPRAGLPKMQAVPEGDVSKKSYKRLHRWRYSPTAAYGNNEVHLHPYKVRRLSAAEALAIQSLPANFALPEDMSLTNKFKSIGNGVPYLMSRGIAKTIASFLEVSA